MGKNTVDQIMPLSISFISQATRAQARWNGRGKPFSKAIVQITITSETGKSKK